MCKGGRSSKDYSGLQGDGGGLGGPKKDYVIFEWSLIIQLSYYLTHKKYFCTHLVDVAPDVFIIQVQTEVTRQKNKMMYL